jgi:aromatic ring-opening dioxygenase catalytic subunit (LigB family)
LAEIVGAFGVPHVPHFPSWVAGGHPLGPEIARLYGDVAKRLRAAEADTLVVFTSDHYNEFFETVPIFCVGVAETAAGASDYDTIPRREVRLDAELARSLHTALVHDGFDVAMSQELELDHTVIAPLHFLVPDNDVAVVPFFVSAFLRPIPSAQRCRALGAAIREGLARHGGERRIALVASGSFSLEIGGPWIGDDSHTGIPDPAWLERVLELLRAGDVETLVAEATDDRLALAGNAAGELLDWIVMLGAMDPSPPDFLDSQAAFGHAFAAWSS